jgi:hypothetical protein
VENKNRVTNYRKLTFFYFSTIPFKINCILPSFILQKTVSFFLKYPNEGGVIFIVIFVFFPGATQRCSYSGIVQPHDAEISFKNNGKFPAFSNKKSTLYI